MKLVPIAALLAAALASPAALAQKKYDPSCSDARITGVRSMTIESDILAGNDASN